MVNQKSREFFYFKIPVFLTDLVIVCLTQFILFRTLKNTVNESSLYAGFYAILAMSLFIAVSVVPIKLHQRRIRPIVVMWRAARMTILAYVIYAALALVVFTNVPKNVILYGAVISTLVISIVHYFANKIIRQFRKFGHNIRHIVIVGADETAKRVYSELMFGQVITGYNVVGFFTSIPDVKLPDGAKMLGSISDLFPWLNDHRPDEVYCSLPPSKCQEDVNRLIQICNDKFIDFYFVPTMDGYPRRKMAIHDFGSVTVFKLRDEPLNNPAAKIVKRVFDIIVSFIFLCTMYPFVFLFVWAGDKVTGSKGPVYFRQARTGYNGKSFMIYKFRSMKVNAEADTVQATKDDPRKTKFGDFLRRTSIDELPQFINVLKGEMSIVGPRPHMEHHTVIYSGLIKNYMVRHLAKPGITGWAQVNGCRGETKTVEEMEARVKRDIWYIEHWTPLIDIEILFKTFWQVLPGHDKQAY